MRVSSTHSARFNVLIICRALSIVKNKMKSFAGRSACGKRRLMAKKDPAAVRLGRRGGKEYARRHTAEERKAQARKAAQARWAKQKGKFSRDTET